MVDPNLVSAGLGAFGGYVLSPAGAALVHKISDAVGWLTAPTQEVRMARGKAAAGLILAQSEIQIAELQAADLVKRAGFRVAVEQVIQQMNIEAIIIRALAHLNENAVPHTMDDGWVLNFFDKCKYVSDEQMQELWAKLIAGEANQPGTFSRKTVNLMADLDSYTANLFSTYCGFAIDIGKQGVPLIVFDQSKELPSIYRDQGIDYQALRVLAEIGLISIGFEHLSLTINYTMSGLPETVQLSYGGQTANLRCPDGFISIGETYPTVIGGQLGRLCAREPVEGFFEFVIDQWDTLCQSPPVLSSLGVGMGYVGD